jgi:hypothetical protein
MKIKVNEGPADRLVRIAIGIVLLNVAAFGGITGPLLIVVLAVALLPLITGLTGFCPTYVPFGISTLADDKR